MAGEGGFKSALNGFDKNEVNDYISKLRKTMKDMEAEKKANDERTAAAVKTAEEAENRVKAAEKQAAEKIAELELQAKTERRNAESMAIQIDELKRKLKSKPGAASAAGKVDTAAAEKKAAEIIAAANKTAHEVVEKAKSTANEIVASAQSAAGSASAGVNSAASEEFMRVLKNYLDTINNGFAEVSKKASELFAEGSSPASAAPVTIPDFSGITAPQADVPESAPVSEKPADSASDMSMGLSGDFFAAMTDDSSDDDMTAFGSDDIAPTNPRAPKAEILESFDLSQVGEPAVDEPVDDIKPLDAKKGASAELDSSFMTDLIAQTVPSSALGSDVDGDLLAAVKEQEEKFAVRPSDEGLDFSMDISGGASADSGAEADDPMAALLAQAQAAFGGGSFGEPEPETEPEPANTEMGMGSSGDWADLQKQLEAMEKSGNFGGDAPESTAAEPAKSIEDDPKAPSADDSAIWNFGDMDSGSSDDDDMSSDLFGNL